METAATSLSGIEIFYLICAVIGGILLLVRLVLQFLGAGDHGDVHDFDAHHLDADASLKLLSLHGLTSFLMMFGLVGFALTRESGAGTLLSLLGALLAGAVSFWVIGKLFAWIVRLQSSGTVSLDEAVGCQGEVYLSIPKDGTGKVTVRFADRLREYDAVSESGDALRTGERIKVVKVRGNTLVVERDGFLSGKQKEA